MFTRRVAKMDYADAIAAYAEEFGISEAEAERAMEEDAQERADEARAFWKGVDGI